MCNIELYTFSSCPYCHRAKALLDHIGIKYTEYEVSRNREKWLEMMERSGRDTVPQIFFDDKHIGGSDNLLDAWKSGEFEPLLNSQPAAVEENGYAF